MSTRKSRRGSASGGGSSISSKERGTARFTSSISGDAGQSPSTTRPPGAATIATDSRATTNCSVSPRGVSWLKRRSARAPSGTSPSAWRRARQPTASPLWTRPRRTEASPSCLAPIAAASSPPAVSSTVSSAVWPPSLLTTVRRSSGCSRTAVAAPGRTQCVSSERSTGLRPGSSRAGRAAVVAIERSGLGRLGLLGLGGFLLQLLGQLALAGGIELLQLVLDHAAVVGLVPVVERVEAEQHRLADE